MAQHTGREGVVKSGGTAIGEMRSWSIDQSSETYQTIEPTMAAPAPALTFEGGATSWTANVEVMWDPDDTPQEALTIGASASLVFYPEGETATNQTITGTGIVTSRGKSAEVSGMVTQSFTFQGTGALAFGTVSA